MPNDLATTNRDIVAILNGTNPFAALPAELARPASYFCACKAHLFKGGATELCANLVYWLKKGLTVDDAKSIFRRLCDPDMARGHNWENQLMADLAGAVDDVLRRRKAHQETMRRREEDAGSRAVVSLADSFGRV